MILVSREYRTPPEWFTDALTSVGGKNRFGGANFDVVWSESATMERDGKTVLICPGPACWLLREWNAPEAYGPPELWNQKETGEAYPQFGKYEIVQPFRASTVVNGRLVHECMELNSLILDMVVPIILQAKGATEEKRMLALKERKEYEEKAQEARIADSLENAAPTWMGPVSYARQVMRTSLIDKKTEEISRQWKHAMTFYSQHGKGASIHNPVVN